MSGKESGHYNLPAFSVMCGCVVVVKFKTPFFLMPPQVFFSMLEIYNEQVTEGEKQLLSFFLLSVSFCIIFFYLSLSSLSRWLTCCLGGLVLRGGSESERSSKEASTWRVSERSRVRAHHR